MALRAIPVRRLMAALVGLVALVLVLGLAFAPPALGGEAYYRGGDIPLDNPDWMTGLSDDLLLSQLSLPGTHDTMARDCDSLGTCQDAPLADQLQAGVRVLDIRCANDYSSTQGHYFSLWHGPLFRLGTFDQVADGCKAFLAAHAGETIIMRMKQELTIANPKVTQSFTDTFKWYRDTKYPGLFADIGDGKTIPTLGAVRGKIVVLQDYDYSPFWGIRYITPGSHPPFDSQDKYVVAFSKAGFDAKWSGIYSHLYATNAGNRAGTWYVNYLSGGTETYPERVAGGYSDGFSATGMNDRMLTLLRASAPLNPPSGSGAAKLPLTCTGTVMIDFPGPGLIQAIINLNGGVPIGFPDVPASHPYYDAITGMADQAIIGGYTNGNFGPEDLVIRQQFAKMIVLTLDLPVAESDWQDATRPFVDLDPDDPAKLYPHEYVAVCALNNITKGTSDPTKFAPLNKITRQQVISMVVRAADNLAPGALTAVPAGWTGGVLPAGDPTHGANIQKAEYNSLLEGIRASLATPGLTGWNTGANATRGEVAQILWNLLRRQ